MSNKNIETRILNNTIDLTNSSNDFIIKKGQSNYLTINNTSGELSLNKTLNMTTLSVGENNTNYLKVDGSGVHVYKSLDLSGNGIIKISDISGLKFNNGTSDALVLDISNLHVNKPLDLSGTGIIKINNNNELKFNNGNNDLVKFNGSKLFTAGNGTNPDLTIDPLLVYSIKNINEYYEKKYFIKTELTASSSVNNIRDRTLIFKDIRENSKQSITFTIKAVSRTLDPSNNIYSSLHLIIFGNGDNDQVNSNKLTWKLNTGEDLDKWNIPDNTGNTNMKFINSTDLQINITSNRLVATEWMITLESIAV